MQRRPSRHGSTASTGSRIFRAALLGMALLCGAATAPAADTPRTIVNIAEISHTIGPGTERITTTAEAQLDISPPPVTGELRIMQLDCGQGCGPAQSHSFVAGDYSTSASPSGPFQPLPAPYNHASKNGTPGQVDTTVPVAVIEADVIPLGAPLFLVLESQSLNRDPSRRETALVSLHDDLTDDRELLRLHETGPDTGIFTAAIEAADPPPVTGDGQISTRSMSTITARFAGPVQASGGIEAQVKVGPIDPHGLVFDRATGAPVDGVAITLIDQATGAPAKVLGDDLRTQFPSTIVTGSTVTDSGGNSYEMAPGRYRFPFVRPGEYRFSLVVPDGYTPVGLSTGGDELSTFGTAGHPSMFDSGGATTMSMSTTGGIGIAPATQHPTGRGSGLEPFSVAPGEQLNINIPLMRAAIVSVTRTADSEIAGAGDFVEFRVEITASSNGAITIIDTLPGEMRKVPGTARIDGAPVATATSPDGRRLTIADHPINAATPLVLRYTAQINVSARSGSTLTSRTDANGSMALASATHALRVEDSFDLDSVAILGQVVAGPCGAPDRERDLSGIRIYTETGEYAVTDASGRFSFRDMTRRAGVLQLDELTLPHGARPILCGNNTRRAGSAISQFIDPRPGLMTRVAFHIEIDPEAEARAQAGPQAESAWNAPDSLDPVNTYTAQWLQLQRLDSAPRVLFPGPGHQAEGRALNLFYLRPANARAEVLVNGRPADSRRRDPAITHMLGMIALERWRGLRLQEGRNTITVILRAPDGAEMFRQDREVVLGGRPARAELLEETSVLRTDGRDSPVIEMRLTDRNGIPVRAGTRVSVRTEAPFAFAPADPRRGASAGDNAPSTTIQAEVGQEGVIRLVLTPTLESATAVIEIPTDAGSITRRVPISAADRPWVLVGIAEGTLAASHIRRHMRSGDGDGAAPAGRVALFAEGVIRGEWLLTLRYDRARDGSGDFHGIDPDKDYIVYGDAGYQGDAAQSRFPLYLRLRREGAEFLIGDFDTALNTGLVSYNRRMTGARAAWETDNWRVMGFAARTDERHITDRIASDGTAGPYALTGLGIVQHSETVRIVTVLRRDSTEELNAQTLVPGVDYVIDLRSGTLRLRRAVPAFTPDLDRNVIVVSYETADAARGGRVVGLRAQADVGDDLTLGATLLAARNLGGEDVNAQLLGADMTYAVTDALTISAEMLQMTKTHAGHRARGHQGELRLSFDDGINRAEAYLRHQRGNVALNATDTDANLTTAGLEFSSRIGGAREGAGIRKGWFINGSAAYARDRLGDKRRFDAELMLVNRQERFSYGGGVRMVEQSDPTGRSRALKALAQVGWTTSDDRLSMELGSEQTVFAHGNAIAPDLSTIDARYRLSDDIVAFASLQTTLDAGQSVAVFGLESAPWAGGSINGGIATARNGAAVGQSAFLNAEQRFEPRAGLTLNLGLDVQHDLGAADVPIDGGLGNPLISDSFATLRGGLRHTTDSWSAGLDAEARVSDSDRTMNLRLSADGQMGDDWTVGGAAFFGQTQPDSGPARRDIDLRVSAAHRGDADAPITLLQGELRNARDDGTDRITGYGSVYHSRYLSAVDSLNLRYGVKYIDTRNNSGRHTDLLNFVGGEYRRDISKKFDIGLHGAIMHSRAQSSVDTSLGVSAGFTPFDNGWMSLGYNFSGFRDGDFSENGHTDKGAFLQFRMKFDQSSVRDVFR